MRSTYTLLQLLLSPGHILLWFQSPWCIQTSASEILVQLSVQLSSLFLPNTTQDSTQLLSSKCTWLLIGTITFSSKYWCDQFICLRRERSSHCSLGNKISQFVGNWFSPHHSLRNLACRFPLLCIQSKNKKCWLSSSFSRLLVTREKAAAAAAERCAWWKHKGSCLCTAPHYLRDSWGTQHWNKTVASRWDCFHIIVRRRKTEFTGRGRVCSSLSLCSASQ